MDVINVEQAKIAEAAGAVAVMALERIPGTYELKTSSFFSKRCPFLFPPCMRGAHGDLFCMRSDPVFSTSPCLQLKCVSHNTADIRYDGGVARMSDPDMIQQIKDAVTIPVMAKARIGHFVEAQILEALEVAPLTFPLFSTLSFSFLCVYTCPFTPQPKPVHTPWAVSPSPSPPTPTSAPTSSHLLLLTPTKHACTHARIQIG